MARAHDSLYAELDDHTPERLALANAAVNEALRLRPDLPEVHLTLAGHLLLCYRDYERARVQLAIAAQALPNSVDVLELTAMIDQSQGRWKEAAANREKATTLDPRRVGLLRNLALTYQRLGRYREAEQTWNRMIEVNPDLQALFQLKKAWWAFAEKADLAAARAGCEALPPSMQNDPEVESDRAYLAMCARDFAAAKEIVNKSKNNEFGLIVEDAPPQISALWLEFLQGNQPKLQEFGAAREQLLRKVEADPTNPILVTAIARTDLALGRKDESIEEAQRAMKMRPISEDTLEGRAIAADAAEIFALAGRPDDALKQLDMLIKMPGAGLNYGDLKTNPAWDPLRKDPRFDKLLAELAPND
jgi:tetratricopeptide (TPR) repeat protein